MTLYGLVCRGGRHLFEVAGDFTAADARAFFNKLIKGAISDVDWLRISAVSSQFVVLRQFLTNVSLGLKHKA